jgi:hypothetical protein
MKVYIVGWRFTRDDGSVEDGIQITSVWSTKDAALIVADRLGKNEPIDYEVFEEEVLEEKADG